MTTTGTTSRPPLSVWRYWWGLIKAHPGVYGATTILRITIFAVMFQITGLLQREFFNALTGDALLRWQPWVWAVLFVVSALFRSVMIMSDMYFYFRWTFSSGAVMRKNMFEHILNQPGARSLPGSTGEAISRFRGDADEVGDFTAWFLFIMGQGLFAIFAVIIMVGINPKITLFVFLPLVGIVAIANQTMSRVQKYREEIRGATGNVTGFIGEMFDAAQAIKAATAEENTLKHFHTLNENRRRTALKDKLFTEILTSIFRNTVNLGTGAILLIAGSALQDGTFTIGDFSLFVYYLWFVSDLTALIGIFFARFRQTGVSLERMDKLMDGTPPQNLVKKTVVFTRGEFPQVQYYPKKTEHRLETLSTRNLTYRYPGTEKGISGVNLDVQRGDFVVVTGRIGSGKTTLLRVLLGLLPKDVGEIYWNGEQVADPANFFIPPRTAYTSQIPLLFSESLRENILLGIPERGSNLMEAIRLAVLDADLEQLDQGLETIIGSRGVKLSGGQKQRTAAARMFVRQPELMVFDDLSSALDVNTERTLWERLFAQRGATCLVVSHRHPALQRASHIIVLKDGRVEDQGKLDVLLSRCEEMRRLWVREFERTE